MCNAPLTTAISEQHQKWVMDRSDFLTRCLVRKGATSVDLCHFICCETERMNREGKRNR